MKKDIFSYLENVLKETDANFIVKEFRNLLYKKVPFNQELSLCFNSWNYIAKFYWIIKNENKLDFIKNNVKNSFLFRSYTRFIYDFFIVIIYIY